MRDFRLIKNKRRPRKDPVIKWGVMPLPFTKEKRFFLMVHTVGFEFWFGPQERIDNFFVDERT